MNIKFYILKRYYKWYNYIKFITLVAKLFDELPGSDPVKDI